MMIFIWAVSGFFLFWLHWFYHAYEVSLTNSGWVRSLANVICAWVCTCLWMSMVPRGLELVLNKARTMQELKGVMVLLLFFQVFLSWTRRHVFEDLDVSQPYKWKEYRNGCSSLYIDLLLCNVSACLRCVCVGWFSDLKEWWPEHAQRCYCFFFCSVFSPLRIPTFILFWFYFTQYCDLKGK